MKRLFATICFVCLASVASAELPLGWNKDFSTAAAEARTNQAPLLVYFTAGWCGPCKLMARTTLTNELVLQALEKMVHVAVDIDESPDLTRQNNVPGVPTFVLFSAGGFEVDRVTSYQTAPDFAAWLSRALAASVEAEKRERKMQERFEQADRLIASQEPGAWHAAATNLFEVCAERDPAAVQSAAARLKVIASEHPESVIDGLLDLRLAVRIQAGNVLRDRFGDKFDVDPWSDSASRPMKVAEWRRKIAQ